jgi:glycosyltransferase involved in cell wall biosynthesis
MAACRDSKFGVGERGLNRPLRVLHLLLTGRAEVASLGWIIGGLVSHLPDRYRVTVLVFNERGPLCDELEKRGAEVHVLPFRGKFDPMGAIRLVQWLRKQQFDIAHHHLSRLRLRALVQAGGPRKTVMHVHGYIGPREARPERIDVRLADAVIANSEAAARWIPEGARVHVIYPGIRVTSEHLHRPERSSVVIGTAARLMPMKGLSVLIEAMGQLRSRCDVHLEIAGEGPLRGELEKQIAQMRLQDSIRLLGWVRMNAALARWDAYVQPSLEESFGMAVLEAMAAGLPVIVTDAGGLPELVNDRCGLIVPRGSAAALAEAIERLAACQPLRTALGAAGFRRAKSDFTEERMAEEIVAVYDALTAGKSAEAFATAP